MKSQAVILMAIVTAMMLSPVIHADAPSDDEVRAQIAAAQKKAKANKAEAKKKETATADTTSKTDSKVTDPKTAETKPAEKKPAVTPPAAPAKPAAGPTTATTKIPASGSTVKAPAAPAKPAATKPATTADHKVEAPKPAASSTAPAATANHRPQPGKATAEHTVEAPKPAPPAAPAKTVTVINPSSVKNYQERIAKIQVAQTNHKAVTPKQKALVIWIDKYRADHHMVGREHDRELWANEVFVHQVYEKLVEIDHEPPVIVENLPTVYPAPPRPPAAIPAPPRPADAPAVAGVSPADYQALRTAEARAAQAEAAYHQCTVNCAAVHDENIRLHQEVAQLQAAAEDANRRAAADAAALAAAHHPHKKVVVEDDDDDDDDRPVRRHRRDPLGLFGQQPGGLLGLNNGMVNPGLFGPNGMQNPMAAYQQQQALAAMQQQAMMQRQAMQYGLMGGRMLPQMYQAPGGFGGPQAMLPWGGGGYSPLLGLNGVNYGGLPGGAPFGYGGGFNTLGNRPPPVVPYQGGIGANYGGLTSPIYNTGGYTVGGVYGGTYGRTLPQVCVAPCPR